MCADYFSEFFAADGVKKEEDKPYVILSEKHWLIHDTPGGIIRALSSKKASGADGVAENIVKPGGNALYSAMLPLFTELHFEGDTFQKIET